MFDLEDFVENPEVTALSGLAKAQWVRARSHGTETYFELCSKHCFNHVRIHV